MSSHSSLRLHRVTHSFALYFLIRIQPQLIQLLTLAQSANDQRPAGEAEMVGIKERLISESNLTTRHLVIVEFTGFATLPKTLVVLRIHKKLKNRLFIIQVEDVCCAIFLRLLVSQPRTINIPIIDQVGNSPLRNLFTHCGVKSDAVR